MRSIKVLPEAIHNCVRSGVVICDLTRIVEELVFNSIDAGATKVYVSVGVGSYYVRVQDNGSGITRDGLVLLGERYATSKVDQLTLLDIVTENLDCHGESLCSISDVSLLEIVTKARGKPNGYRKIMKNCKCLFLGINDARKDVGTTVTVCDIFYNQPVRRKHMDSSPKKVLDSIKMSLLRIALVHVNICFKVVDAESEDELLHTGPSSSPLPILSSYFGIGNSATFYKLNLSYGELKLSGYISDPHEIFSPKAIQYVYINSRFVYKGPIHKLLNQLAAKFDSLGSWQPASSFLSEKRNKYDMCPMFMLNLHCPRCFYDIVISERTSVEFKDWGPVLTFIEKEVMRVWTENISPRNGQDTFLVASEKDMPDTSGNGKKKCRKQDFQTPLDLDSPRKKKLRNDYDNMVDFEGWVSSCGKLSRKDFELNKHQKEAGLPCETDYLSPSCGGSVFGCRVTTNKESRNHLSPCIVYSWPQFDKEEDGISSALWNSLPAVDAKIDNISIVSEVSADCRKFSDDVHFDREPKRNFLRSCSIERSLLHDINSPAINDRFELGSDNIRFEKKWIDCDDSMVDETNLVFCGRRDLHCKEAPLFQPSSVIQYEMDGMLEHPTWNLVESSLVFSDNLHDSSKLGRRWTPSWQCFRSGWSPLTGDEKNGIEFLDNGEASQKNLIKDFSEFGKETIGGLRGYYAQREDEDLKHSNLNTKYGWLQKKCSIVNLCPDSEGENGEFHLGDFEKMFSPKPFKRFCETDWSHLSSYGEESPKYYSVPSLYDTSHAAHDFEQPTNIRKQRTTSDKKKIFLRSHSAPPFCKRKTRCMDLSDSSIILSTKSNFGNISSTLPSTEPSNSSPGRLHSETRNLKFSQMSFGQSHLSAIERPAMDYSVAERPVSEMMPEVTVIENGGPQKLGQVVNMESVECSGLDSMESRDSVDSRWKWRKCLLPSAGGSRSDNNKDQDIILDVSSDILLLAGDSAVPTSIDRMSLEDAQVLNQVDKKFIAVVAGKILALIDQHAADERIRLEDLRQKVLSGEMKTITYLDAEQELFLPETGYQLLQNYAAQIQTWGWICNIHSQDTSSFSKHLDFLHRQRTTVKLLAVPCILGVKLTDIDLLEFLQQLADTDGSSTIPPSVRCVLNNKACRGAIMFGDTLLPSECSLIVEELKRTSLCFQCAHGRPTTVPLVNLDLLHNRIAKLGSPHSWHGLRQHNKFSLGRCAKRLSSALR